MLDIVHFKQQRSLSLLSYIVLWIYPHLKYRTSQVCARNECKQAAESLFVCAQARLYHSTHLQSSLGLPGETQLVGLYGCCDGGPVVAAPAHQHHTQPGHSPLSAECHLGGAGGHLFPVWSMELVGD